MSGLTGRGPRVQHQVRERAPRRQQVERGLRGPPRSPRAPRARARRHHAPLRAREQRHATAVFR